MNVTPDSFSDGGRALDPADAVEAALQLVRDGAGIIDLGAESTRPGAARVEPAEEQRRLLPVLRALRPLTDVPISVDTRNASTAEAALEVGADAINDVSMLRHDPGIARLVGRRDATLVLSHSKGGPDELHAPLTSGDPVKEVACELGDAASRATAAECRKIVLDPGLGFGKTVDQNLALVRHLHEIVELGYPVLVGCSRKRFVGALLAERGVARDVSDRVHGSVGAALAACSRGASYLRVHDVRPTADALAVFRAVERG